MIPKFGLVISFHIRAAIAGAIISGSMQGDADACC